MRRRTGGGERREEEGKGEMKGEGKDKGSRQSYRYIRDVKAEERKGRGLKELGTWEEGNRKKRKARGRWNLQKWIKMGTECEGEYEGGGRMEWERQRATEREGEDIGQLSRRYPGKKTS